MNERQALAVLAELAPTYDGDAAALRAARAQVDAAIAAETAEAAAPRRGRRRVGWLVAAATVSAVSVGSVLWPSGGSGAYASWTAEPSRARADQVSAARSSCDDVMTHALAHAKEPGARMPGSEAELAGQQVRLAEQRGDVTLVVTSNATWLQACLAALPVSPLLTQTASVDLRGRAATVDPTAVEVLSAQSEGTDRRSIAVVVGRAGSGVSGIRITTTDGRTVHAELSGGYWSAWWPTGTDGHLMPADVQALWPDGTGHEAGTIADLLARA